MCLQPCDIPNPNYHKKNGLIEVLKDTESKFISVPCGHCPQCIARRQSDIVQRVLMESLQSQLFFVTLTYQDKFLKHVVTSSGFDYSYADPRDLQLLFKRLRKIDSFLPFSYFAVSENGGERLRPHFHFILAVNKKFLPSYWDCISYKEYLWKTILDNWKTNVSNSDKFPIYEPNLIYKENMQFGIKRRNYDVQFVDSTLSSNSISNVSFYTIKYMLKPNPKIAKRQQALRLNLDEEEYNFIWNTIKPKNFVSKGFGLYDSSGLFSNDIVSYLKHCIKRTPLDSAFPFFYSPYNGFSSPLCEYYRSIGDIYSLKNAIDFACRIGNPSTARQVSKSLNDFIKFEKMVRRSDEHTLFDID